MRSLLLPLFLLLGAPAAAQQEIFTGQVDGPCTEGTQWIGGFVGAFVEDGHGQATLRRCAARDLPLIQLICPHRSDTLSVSLTLPNDIVSPRLPMQVTVATHTQVFRFAGLGQTDQGWPRIDFEVPRNGELIAALKAGSVAEFSVGRITTTVNLTGSSQTLDAMESACILP